MTTLLKTTVTTLVTIRTVHDGWWANEASVDAIYKQAVEGAKNQINKAALEGPLKGCEIVGEPKPIIATTEEVRRV